MFYKRRTAFKRFKYNFRDYSPTGSLMLPTNKQFLYKVLTHSIFNFCVLAIAGSKLSAQPVTQATHAKSYSIQALEFRVVDIERPITRQGKLLNSLRYIYLESSRPATSQEAREATRAEKRAIKRRQKRRSRATANHVPWEGQLLKVFRLGPPMPDQDQAVIREEFEKKLRNHRDKILGERNQKIDSLAFRGLPIAKSKASKKVASLLETGDDDDELGSEELTQDQAQAGSFCGGLKQECCLIDQENYCKPSLVCVERLNETEADSNSVKTTSICVDAEERKVELACGEFEQRCCEGYCHSSSLICSENMCQLPPIKPQRIKTPVGILQISKVNQVYDEHGELVKSVVQAAVRYDALRSSKDNRALNAIRLGDYARWY